MFNHFSQLDEQVEAHLNLLRRNGWLTFKGSDAVDLLRRAMLVKPQPLLIAHCHYSLAAAPHDYEFFTPESVEVIPRSRNSPKLVKITGRSRGQEGPVQTLFWHPDKPTDPSGTFLSSVSTLANCFPASAIAGIQLAPLSL